MSTPTEILTAIAPELATVPDARRDLVLAIAEGQTGAVFGDQRNYAVALLAAHILTVGARAGNGGAVTRAEEGDLALSFAASSVGDDLGVTSYGRELRRLRRQYIFGPRTRVC